MKNVLFGNKISISDRIRGLVVWKLNIMHNAVCSTGSRCVKNQ